MNRHFWFLLALTLLAVSPAIGKAPTLTGFFPSGAARGRTVVVTASGTFDHWPVGCWVDGPGLTIKPGRDKGLLSVTVADDAEPGLRWVRLHDSEGATSLRPFVVGTLGEIIEVEPNDDPLAPQKVAVAEITVNGRLGKTGDVDGFAVTLRRGQTLVADVLANRVLASPMDAVLQVADASGIVLDQNDDADGRDPRVVFKAPADATYLVRLFAFPTTPDSSIRFAGGDAFVYRLTLTTGGLLDHTYPLAVSRVEAIGANIADADRSLDADREVVSDPKLAGTATVRRVPYPTTVEAEPNDRDHPQAIAGKIAVSGRIDPPGDRDTYRVSLKAGESRTIRVESRSIGLPLDPVLTVLDPAGRAIAEVDDSGDRRDPEYALKAPIDGDYRLGVRDLHGRGGPRYLYLLSVLPPDPDFSLTLASDRVDLSPGKEATLVVTVDRKDGYSGMIDITVLEVPLGISVISATSKPGDASAKSVTLKFKADDCACPGAFRVVGRGSDPVGKVRMATASIAGFAAKTDRPWMAIGTTVKDVKK